MKTLKAKLNIKESPGKITEVNICPDPPAAKPYRYIDRKEARNWVIQSGIYTEKEVKKMEKIGCGKIVLNQLEISPCCRVRELLARKDPKNILNGLKIFMAALGGEAAVVYTPKKNKAVLNSLLPIVRRTPNVYEKTVYDRYPLGMEAVFSRRVLHQSGDYFPGKKGTLIISPEKALRLNSFAAAARRRESRQVLCVLREGEVYYIRVGREKKITVAELLEKINIEAEGFIIAGDPLSGKSITNPQKETIDGKILITLLPRTSVDPGDYCYSCGRCVEVCPAGLKTPRSRKSLQQGQGIIPASGHRSCLGCGLCGYFCPGWLR